MASAHGRRAGERDANGDGSEGQDDQTGMGDGLAVPTHIARDRVAHKEDDQPESQEEHQRPPVEELRAPLPAEAVADHDDGQTTASRGDEGCALSTGA